ncbi:hypothetical protein ABT382_30650 [Streptomyces pharetrae]|uniref:hypothetical protein n=1 Tax=Streptomyces pharetrae TaxID=291370 RepID=UPI00335D014D
MRWLTELGEFDRVMTQQAASRIPPGVGKVLSAVEETAESTSCGVPPQRRWHRWADGAGVGRRPRA